MTRTDPALIDEALRIVHDVAYITGHTVNELLSPSRERDLTHARQLAMHEIRHDLPLSLPAIGRIFHRHHTTVLHSIQQVQKRAGGG